MIPEGWTKHDGEMAAVIAPIRHRYAPFGLKRAKVMAIDLEIAMAICAYLKDKKEAI
jgi:hypothetical protein